MTRRSRTAVATLLLLAACDTPVSETIAARAGGGWALQSVSDAAAPAPLRIDFASDGTMQGTGPCNQLSARQTAPLPWFELAEVAVTQRACPLLAEETILFDALLQMAFSEVNGDTLMLTDEQGETLLFTRADGDV